jgi:hypothetical protein
MTHLTARLESLLRLYAAAQDQGEGDAARLREQFRKDVEPLVAQYGRRATTSPSQAIGTLQMLDPGPLTPAPREIRTD